MVKAIIFDFGQTLADAAGGFRAAEKKAEADLFSQLKETPWEEFLARYRKLRKNFQERSEFSRKLLWREVLTSYGVVPEIGYLLEWERVYWEQVEGATTLFPETVEVLNKLASHYRLAIITNTRGETKPGPARFHQFPGFVQLFDSIIVAGEGGIPPKPDPMSFRRCLDQLGITAAEALYLGDDWRIDICGARDMGMHHVWVQHHSVTRSWPQNQTSVPIITSLKNLLELDTLLPQQPNL